MQVFFKNFEVRWADLDPNRHLRHTAYNDFGSHVRVRFFSEHEFGPDYFGRHQFGPVLFREEVVFLKEVGMTDTVKVDMQLAWFVCNR